VLETPHAIVGAVIVSKIPNPIISLPLAFASHFVLDMVPHWNPHLNTEIRNKGKISSTTTLIVAADVLLAIISGVAISSLSLPDTTHAGFVLMGAFSGVLPDVVEAPYFFLGWKTKAIEKWLSFQKSIQSDTTPFAGLMTQVATVLASIWWVIGG